MSNSQTNDSRRSSPSNSVDETEKQKAQHAESEMDGGLRAWLRVLGCFLILANTMGLQVCYGVFQEFYERSLLSDYSPSIIAWIGTIQIFFTTSGGFLSGPLFDLGYDKPLLLLGCFFAILGFMMLSLSTSYYQIFLTQGVSVGLAGLCSFSPTIALSAVSFKKRRSLAVGITTAGFAFGAVIYSIVFRELQPRIGFPWATRVMAFIALGCLSFAYPLVYWKTPRSKSPARKMFDAKAWKEAPYATYCLAVFFMYAGYWPPYFYIVSFAYKGIGTSAALASFIFAISNAANCISRFTVTLLADRFGTIEVLTAATLCSTIVAFCWSAVDSVAGTIVWAIFWGYFSGTMSALFAAVVPSLSPSPSVVGTRLGMVNGLFGIGCLISPPIAGAILSSPGSTVNSPSGFLGVQMFVGGLLATATCLFIYPLLHLRRKRKEGPKEGS